MLKSKPKGNLNDILSPGQIVMFVFPESAVRNFGLNQSFREFVAYRQYSYFRNPISAVRDGL